MIANVDSIDIIGVRKDGGLDLVIVSAGQLEPTQQTQTLLLDKLERYMGYLKSSECRSEHPDANADNTSIILRLDEEPGELFWQLFEGIGPWVEDNGAVFRVEVKPPA